MAIKTNIITITIRYPPRVLNPNARPSWHTLWKAKSNYKDAAYVLALAAGMPRPPWLAVRASLHFYNRTAHAEQCDRDNSIAQMKSAMDGIALAGLVPHKQTKSGPVPEDHRIKWGEVEHEKAAPGTYPRVVITLERIPDGK